MVSKKCGGKKGLIIRMKGGGESAEVSQKLGAVISALKPHWASNGCEKNDWNLYNATVHSAGVFTKPAGFVLPFKHNYLAPVVHIKQQILISTTAVRQTCRFPNHSTLVNYLDSDETPKICVFWQQLSINPVSHLCKCIASPASSRPLTPSEPLPCFSNEG